MDFPGLLGSDSLWGELEESDTSERKQDPACGPYERRQWRRQLRRAALRGSEEDVAEVLGRACACHEAEVREAAGRALLDASTCGHADLLRLLIAHGVSVHTQMTHNKTALHFAAACNHVECVKVLLDHGADPNAVDTARVTVLHCAADGGAAECVRVLLERGAVPNSGDWNGDTPLYFAAKGSPRFHMTQTYSYGKLIGRNKSIDYLQCVKELCRPEHIIGVSRKEMNFAFLAAIETGNMDIVQYFIEEVADLSYKTTEGHTALHRAAACSKIECIRALVRAGMDVDCRGTNGQTPLHLAATPECAQVLLYFGADIHAVDNQGWTAMHYVANLGIAETMRVLLFAGCKITIPKADLNERSVNIRSSASFTLANATSLEGRTPLHVAAHHWNLSCMEELVLHGADVFAKDHQGWLALHFAAHQGFTVGMRFLLQQGLQLEAPTAAGETALHLCTRAGREQCVRELLRLHVRVNARDAAGRTALHEAARNANENVTRALLESGADRSVRDAEGLTPAAMAATPAVERLIARWGVAA